MNAADVDGRRCRPFLTAALAEYEAGLKVLEIEFAELF
jgi:hypothetical protein